MAWAWGRRRSGIAGTTLADKALHLCGIGRRRGHTPTGNIRRININVTANSPALATGRQLSSAYVTEKGDRQIANAATAAAARSTPAVNDWRALSCNSPLHYHVPSCTLRARRIVNAIFTRRMLSSTRRACLAYVLRRQGKYGHLLTWRCGSEAFSSARVTKRTDISSRVAGVI